MQEEKPKKKLKAKSKGPWNLTEHELEVSLLNHYLKEQSAENDKLKQVNNELKANVQDLEKKLADVRIGLTALKTTVSATAGTFAEASKDLEVHEPNHNGQTVYGQPDEDHWC